jgi:hypothetical protein
LALHFDPSSAAGVFAGCSQNMGVAVTIGERFEYGMISLGDLQIIAGERMHL